MAFRLVKILLVVCFIGVLGATRVANAGLPVSRAEFETLAIENARNVDVFGELWSRDPEAKIFGGAARDYLLWLVAEIKSGPEGQSFGAIRQRLATRGSISASEFLRRDSDLDVLSYNSRLPDGARFGIGKVESIPFNRLDARTDDGRDEIKQGFLPTEKVLLGRSSLTTPSQFGDGVGEIYSNRPTMKVGSRVEFDSTRFARLKLNHPVLLAARWVRAVSMAYRSHVGAEMPLDISLVDQASFESAKAAATSALTDRAFLAVAGQPRAQMWLVKSLTSSFSRYASRNVSQTLFDSTGLEQVVRKYQLFPYNQLAFHGSNGVKTEALVRSDGLDPSAILRARDVFTEGLLFHGTPAETTFRAIVRDGFIPSSMGAMGKGLYAVDRGSFEIAVNYSGNDTNRIIAFQIEPDSRVIDVTSPRGSKLFEQLSSLTPGARSQTIAEQADAIAQRYGIDAFVYDLAGRRAVVIKNGASVGQPTGYARRSMSPEQLRARAAAVSDDASFLEFVRLMSVNEVKGAALFETINEITYPSEFPRRLRQMREQVSASGLSSHEASFVQFALLLEAVEVSSRGPRRGRTEFLDDAAAEMDRLISQLRAVTPDPSIMSMHAKKIPSIMDQNSPLMKTIRTLDKNLALKRSEIGVLLDHTTMFLRETGRLIMSDINTAFVLLAPTYLMVKVVPDLMLTSGLSRLLSYGTGIGFFAVFAPALYTIVLINLHPARLQTYLSNLRRHRERMSDRQETTQWARLIGRAARDGTSPQIRSCEALF